MTGRFIVQHEVTINGNYGTSEVWRRTWPDYTSLPKARNAARAIRKAAKEMRHAEPRLRIVQVHNTGRRVVVK